jgi:hypothetical protein
MSWLNALIQSYERNRIIDYSSLLSVATINNNLPAVFPLRFQQFCDDLLVFYTDRRSVLCGCLLSQPSEFLWLLPVTSEYFKLSGNVFAETDPARISSLWSSLAKREKEGYCGLPPDVLLVPSSLADTDRFKPQEASAPSSNFQVLLLRPSRVEHFRYVDKSAIGNTRKTYETLPQPDAVSHRWLHELVSSEWHTTELSAGQLRP